MNKKIQDWINAAKILGADIDAKVICPECKTGHLYVSDKKISGWLHKFDRYIICDKCEKFNVLTLEKR